MDDLKNVLTEGKSEKGKSKNNKKHKKPLQLREIESVKMNHSLSKMETREEMKSLLNKEKDEILKQPWNKLDNGMKLNRLKIFIQAETKEKGLNDEQKSKLKKLLFGACKSNKLNKNTEVIYDREKTTIEKIKNLHFVDGDYTLEITEVKKQKSSTKSRSNIDRFIRHA